MTKQEFEKIVGKQVSYDDYSTIETVYAYHPCISEVDGKEQIAYLFNTFGMRVINDMLSTARTTMKYEEELRQLKTREEELRETLRRLRTGEDV